MHTNIDLTESRANSPLRFGSVRLRRPPPPAASEQVHGALEAAEPEDNYAEYMRAVLQQAVDKPETGSNWRNGK